MNQWSIGKKIFTSFLASSAITLLLGLVGYYSAVKSDDAIREVGTNRLPSVRALLIIANAQTEVDGGENALLIHELDLKARQAKYADFTAALERADDAWKIYEPLQQTAEEEAIWKKFVPAWQAWVKDHEALVEISKEYDKTLEAQQKGETPARGNELFKKLSEQVLVTNDISLEKSKKLLDKLVEINHTIGVNTSATSISQAEALKWVNLVVMVVGVVVALLLGIFTTRSLVVPLKEIVEFTGLLAQGDFSSRIPERLSKRGDEIGTLSRGFALMIKSLSDLISQVQRSGLQVNSSAVEIAATTKEQQTTASEVATTSAEISATAKEMSATSTELLKTADSVSSVAEQASELAAGGKGGLERMEIIMRGILDASVAITAKLGVMNEKAGNINAVVSTIGKVADQTNLLSLNAAIEAEKAGEYGRGFAVVATEIRRLADQTAASTGDIEQMVKEMVSAVSSGVMGMDKFAEELRRGAAEISGVGVQLDRVISEVRSLAPSVESVNEGMRSQTLGAQQISEALSQLGDAARLTAESIRDSSRAIDQLNEVTRGLQSGIARFKLPG